MNQNGSLPGATSKENDIPRSLQYKSIEVGGPRVKFDSQWKGSISDFLKGYGTNTAETYKELCQDMSDFLWELEENGVAPTYPDGKVGGNAAAILKLDGEECIVVSKSGKLSRQKMDPTRDVCIVSGFDTKKWSADYSSVDKSILPTSDSPMHYSVLLDNKKYGWSVFPEATLHGHALETEEEAERYGFPISKEETMFSTQEDTVALEELLVAYPYPEHKVFIRKGHGFFILGKDLKETLEVFRQKIKPFVAKKKI